MTKYAPVGPISWLEQLQDVNLLGDYLLLLAHDVLEEPHRYGVLMKRVKDSHPNPFIILDNSVIELGAALPPAHMKAACDIIGPTCVVLADVLERASETVVASYHSADNYRRVGISCPFMAVIQGESIPQLQWCAQQLAIELNPHYWGLPRIVANTIGTRRLFTDILGLSWSAIKPTAHLLGMSQKLSDDLLCCNLHGVMGIDSANPLILGQKGQLMSDPSNYQHVSREGIWGKEPLTPVALANIEHIRDSINYP